MKNISNFIIFLMARNANTYFIIWPRGVIFDTITAYWVKIRTEVSDQSDEPMSPILKNFLTDLKANSVHHLFKENVQIRHNGCL